MIDVLAGVMLMALIAYALFAGADFGGGVWDLFATGPRKAAQRKLIEEALAPVWEANHVWLIFVIVVLFTAFPSAYAAIGTALHIPLTLALLGIVLRGSAFVFRQYGGGDDVAEHRYGRIFAVASLLTPIALGMTLAALASGRLGFVGRSPREGYVSPWLSSFPLSVGFLALALFALLAASYLTRETRDPVLQGDFRRRGLIAALLSLLCEGVAALLIPHTSPLWQRFVGAPAQGALIVVTLACLALASYGLFRRAYRLARFFASAHVTGVLLGFGLAQYPYLVAPDITLWNAAAPAATLTVMLPILIVGGALVLPALYVLLRLFKSGRHEAPKVES